MTNESISRFPAVVLFAFFPGYSGRSIFVAKKRSNCMLIVTDGDLVAP